jgi:glycosyltransferase involved in cell wall biosynthesis
VDEVDIFVAPLSVNTYNICKSSIKFLEASTSSKPGCWQNIRQYQEVIDGTNGFLCSTEDQWYTSIKKLIDDKVLRKQMGENAFKTIQDWTIQGHTKDYANFFKKLVLDK